MYRLSYSDGGLVGAEFTRHLHGLLRETTDVRPRAAPSCPTTNRRRGPHTDKVKPNRLGEEQYYKVLLNVIDERLKGFVTGEKAIAKGLGWAYCRW